MLIFFFFNDTATTEIYTLSLHDALPISCRAPASNHAAGMRPEAASSTHRTARQRRWSERDGRIPAAWFEDRKSTRLNSSHQIISYAVFCLKKKENIQQRWADRQNTRQLC